MGELQYLFLIVASLLMMAAQIMVQSAYSRYAKVENGSGLTGKDVAEDILARNGWTDVKIGQSSGGELSDHFDPTKMIVNLSPGVYNGRSIAAAAIAAHELGHIMQHQTGYSAITLRNRILPAAIVASNISWGVIMLGVFIANYSGSFGVFYAGLALIGVVGAFQLVTLPVEFNASSRALKMVNEYGYISGDQGKEGAKKVLNAAAFTYIAALASTIFTILRLVLSVAGNRKR